MKYIRYPHKCSKCGVVKSSYGLKKINEDTWVCRSGKCAKQKTSLIKNNVENLYKMLSFKGDFDIHRLKERDPEMYKKIMRGD